MYLNSQFLGIHKNAVAKKKNLFSMCTHVQKMTKEQLSCEKTVLQKNLLHYEGLHGRPVSLQPPSPRAITQPLLRK